MGYKRGIYMFKRLGGIKFGLMSPEAIRKMSVLEIKSPDLYDKDGFPVEGGLMDPHLGIVERGRRCKTCGQTMDKCTGHFGHIELVRPVIHVGFYKKVELLLNLVCKDCNKFVLTDDEISSLTKQKTKDELYSALISKSRGKSVCPHCGAKKAKVKLDPPTNFYLENAEVEGGFVKLYPNEIRETFEKIKKDDLER
jgi:DNA-directed RNA polymerase subunit A'